MSQLLRAKAVEKDELIFPFTHQATSPVQIFAQKTEQLFAPQFPRTLRQRGNLSSVSVLTVMQDYLLNRPGRPDCYSMIGFMGPAFCTELSSASVVDDG
jgi:hypothetical protein